MTWWLDSEISEHDVVEAKSKPKLAAPKKYKVILLNDDYTPMEFVVQVLKKFFFMSEELAVTVMLQIHVVGKAVCGTYPHEIAETKVRLVNDYSYQHEHPLLCVMEPE